MKFVLPQCGQDSIFLLFRNLISSAENSGCLASYHSWMVWEMSFWESERSWYLSHSSFLKDRPQKWRFFLRLFICLAVWSFQELTNETAKSALINSWRLPDLSPFQDTIIIALDQHCNPFFHHPGANEDFYFNPTVFYYKGDLHYSGEASKMK